VAVAVTVPGTGAYIFCLMMILQLKTNFMSICHCFELLWEIFVWHGPKQDPSQDESLSLSLSVYLLILLSLSAYSCRAEWYTCSATWRHRIV